MGFGEGFAPVPDRPPPGLTARLSSLGGGGGRISRGDTQASPTYSMAGGGGREARTVTQDNPTFTLGVS
jgi:hypothetical protein